MSTATLSSSATRSPQPVGGQTLLKLQIGPVQEFIGQARSTRDLWSGSYLLSWLMAAGTKALVEAVGGKREAVVSPCLKGQPLFELHEDKRPAPADDRASRPADENDELLTPNFTNILVAILPKDQAARIVRVTEKAIRDVMDEIADACWKKMGNSGILGTPADGPVFDARRKRFFEQVACFPSITWQLTPVPPDGRIETFLVDVPLEPGLRQKALAARDPDDGIKPDFFPAQTLRNAWQLDAVRQVREFHAWKGGGWVIGDGEGLANEKDSLTGREEAIVGGGGWWGTCIKPIVDEAKRAPALSDDRFLWPILFRKRHADDHYGALTLIKKVWHWAYLWESPWRLNALNTREHLGKQFPFPSTAHIAIHDPAKNREEWREAFAEEMTQEVEAEQHSPYFAVLAMDGDAMGKWLGGEFHGAGPTKAFREKLSERLSHFALNCARPIVEACDGRLIYVGGEDVLALLPADTALACARFLRLAYRGDGSFIPELQDLAKRLLEHHLGHGYEELPDRDKKKPEISAALSAAARGQLFRQAPNSQELICNRQWPHDPTNDRLLMLPGQIARQDGTEPPEVSCGIAIAHFKDPLQDVVQEATLAEKRAKNRLGRAALAVTLLKRSGETIEWGCKWNSGGLELLREIQAAVLAGRLSTRFPHRVTALLNRYRTDAWGAVATAPGFEAVADDVIAGDFLHVLGRSVPGADKDEEGKVAGPIERRFGYYLRGGRDDEGAIQWRGLRTDAGQPPDAQTKLDAIIGLCAVAAFLGRLESEALNPPINEPAAESAAVVP